MLAMETGEVWKDQRTDSRFELTKVPSAGEITEDSLIEMRSLLNDEIFTKYYDTFRSNFVKVADTREEL